MWSAKKALPYHRQEEILQLSGQHGEAKVITARVTGSVTDGPPNYLAWGMCRFLLQVTPDDGQEPFEIRVHMRIPGNVGCEIGTRFPVLFDPDNHQFTIVDPVIVPRTREDPLNSKLYTASMQPGGLGAPRTPAQLEQIQEGLKNIAPPSQFTLTPQARIAQLDQLKAAGLIDDAQYQAKVAKLTQ
ncbi:MAG: hypothetical protein ACLP8S_26735 [Solirubrobacteraceae bacterium]